MRALTLIQPWARAIVSWGKRVENRTWTPPASLLGQRIAIHAGRKWDAGYALKTVEDLADDHLLDGCGGAVTLRSLQSDCGKVLGVAVLLGWLNHSGRGDEENLANGVSHGAVAMLAHDPWWMGPVGWLLGDVHALQEPIPCRGMLGLWDLPREVEASVLAQVTP